MAGSILNGVRSDDRPEVSVLMPVYNGENYIREGIQSILEQRDVRFELIVVDDGSTDGTVALLDEYGDDISVHTVGNRGGIGPARNVCVEKSSGDFLVFTDHDDLFPEGSLALRRSLFDRRDGIDMVSGAVDEFVPDELVEKLASEGVRPRTGISGSVTSVMVRRSSFDRVGPFEPMVQSSCMNWRMRAQTIGLDVENTDEVVYRRRLHETNSSRQALVDPRLRLEAIRRARAAQGVAGT